MHTIFLDLSDKYPVNIKSIFEIDQQIDADVQMSNDVFKNSRIPKVSAELLNLCGTYVPQTVRPNQGFGRLLAVVVVHLILLISGNYCYRVPGNFLRKLYVGPTIMFAKCKVDFWPQSQKP